MLLAHGRNPIQHLQVVQANCVHVHGVVFLSLPGLVKLMALEHVKPHFCKVLLWGMMGRKEKYKMHIDVHCIGPPTKQNVNKPLVFVLLGNVGKDLHQ